MFSYHDIVICYCEKNNGRLTSLKIMNLLKSINKAGKSVILVTHDKEAAHYANRIIELKDGRIINEIS